MIPTCAKDMKKENKCQNLLYHVIHCFWIIIIVCYITMIW